MAVTVNGYNVGTDSSLTVLDSFGDVFMSDDLGYLMSFESEATDQMNKITPISQGGVPILQTIWNGGTGSLMYTRFGPSFQQLFLDLASAYHDSGTIPQFQVSLNVKNRDGSIDEYLYAGVQFTRPRFGTFRGIREVDMRVDFGWATC